MKNGVQRTVCCTLAAFTSLFVFMATRWQPMNGRNCCPFIGWCFVAMDTNRLMSSTSVRQTRPNHLFLVAHFFVDHFSYAFFRDVFLCNEFFRRTFFLCAFFRIAYLCILIFPSVPLFICSFFRLALFSFVHFFVYAYFLTRKFSSRGPLLRGPPT